MSEDIVETRAGFLLLRDGHAVPLAGISPDDIKRGAKHRVPYPEAEPLRHRRVLTAIVNRLGFQGDFGDFRNHGWSAFQGFLAKSGCTHRAGLFPADHGGSATLFFREVFGPTRRRLADRIFESNYPPKRVFLGYGIDWAVWDQGFGYEVAPAAIATVEGDPTSAAFRARALYKHRLELSGQWGFLDDKLVHDPVQPVVDKTYWTPGCTEQQRKDSLKKVKQATRAFRGVFDASPVGWVDVLRYNKRLVVLRAHDGGWDVLWRSFRDEEPPQLLDVVSEYRLSTQDLPAFLATESTNRRYVHFRQEVWEEREAHEAEQSFYDCGGSPVQRRNTSFADVRMQWLRKQGQLPTQVSPQWVGTLPPGFHPVVVAGRRLAVSELVDIQTFQKMFLETGYSERRDPNSEPWDRANPGDPGDPVGATWNDAQAFCAWRERELGVSVRLLHKDELRALRPFFSERYANIAGDDFLWENYPPRPLTEATDKESRIEVPSAVAWSEPRFLEPSPELPEYPPPGGWSSKSRKRWITDFPPYAPWRDDLHWTEYAGLRFIDAWDAYELCQEWGWISGRFWEGYFGAASWGAYKNLKITFRIAFELGE